LIHSNRTAAGGQTEFPYGCGRVALRAWEENERAGSRCRCPRRVAGDLLAGGCGRLDDHDRDHALQGLAAVRGRNLSASSADLSTGAAVSAADLLVDRGDRPAAEAETRC
jgi:hypothetical protein